MKKLNISWGEVEEYCAYIAAKVNRSDTEIDQVVGIQRGGVIPASLISRILKLPLYLITAKSYDGETRGDLSIYGNSERGNSLYIDDICDSGETMGGIYQKYKGDGSILLFASLHYRPSAIFTPDFTAKTVKKDEWIVYPWEMY